MSTVETDVVLDADGGPVFRAFDQIEARMKGIQARVDAILVRAKSAADAFGGANLKTLRDLDKVMGTLEKFDNTIKKNSPALQSDTAWKEHGRQVKQRQKEELDHAAQIDRAYAERDRKEAARLDKLRRQEESDAARRAREDMSAEQRRERLEAQRFATARANELRLERERDKVRAKENQQRSKIAPKNMREDMRSEIEAARSLRDLDNQRLLAANRIHEARQRLGKGTVEEDRALHNIITQERERLNIAQRRIKEIDKPASNSRIDRSLDVKAGRIEEQGIAAAMTSLGAAKARQAELQDQINRKINLTRQLTGEEKIAAENLLKIDEARLGVINRRVTALQREHDKAIKDANTPPPAPPGSGDGGSKQPKGRGFFGTMGSIVGRTAAYGGAAAAIYGTISAIRDGITAAVEFEDQMAKISAVAGLTATQSAKLSASIRDVAANSRFATQEIAEATMVLAQAGFSASDIGNSLQQIANLAAAAGVGFAEATDVVTGAIGAFQLQTSETGHIADVLSAALNTTKLNIQQVALGIQYAGATAYENKMSFDELTASMATMAQAGIRSGSTIGTGLRQFLVDLQTPTKKMAEEFKKLGITMADIDVKTLGLPQVLQNLSEAGFSSASAYSTMETRAAAAFLVLKNNQGLLNEQIVLQNELGNSAEAAAKGSDSLAAEWQTFKNQVNESVADNSKGILGWIRDLLHETNQMNADGGLRKMTKDLEKLEEGSDAYSAQVNAIQEYKESLYEALEAESAHAAELEAAKTKVNEANEAYNEVISTIDASTDAVDRLVQREDVLRHNKTALNAETASLMNRFDGLAAQLVGLTDNYDNLLLAMQRVRAEAISFGALRASEQYMGLREQNTAERNNANTLSAQIMRRGLKEKAPANVQAAIEALARDQNNPKAGQQARLVHEYATRNLTGGDQRLLQGWAKSISRIGIGNRDLEKARTNVDVMSHLGSEGGQKLYNQVDHMSDMKPAEQKAFLKQLEAARDNPANSPSKRGAYDFLVQQATAKMGSGEPPRAPEEKKKKDRSGSRAEREEDRRVQARMRLKMKAAQAELEQALEGMLDVGFSQVSIDGEEILSKNKTLTNEQFSKNLDRVSASIDAWVDARTAQVEAEIDAQNMGQEEADMMRADLAREVKAKREETSRKVSDGIVEALDTMVDAIMQVKEDAEAAADQKLALAESRLAALGRSNLRGKVPDYVQDTYQRSADRAKDDNDREKIAINDAALQQLRQQLADAEAKLNEAYAKGFEDKKGVAQKSVDDLTRQIRDLTFANDALKASFGGESLIPQSFNDQLKMAVENYREMNNLTASWSDMIGMNLTDSIGTAHSSLEQFLNDATSGTMSVKAAWGNMVRSLIGYLKQLLIKMIAVKIMQMALGAMGFGARSFDPQAISGGITGASDTMSTDLSGLLGRYYGGIAAYTGRYVTKGVPSRDSVNMKVAKGEYVVRKSAVDSVGVDFMNSLNERGAMAVKASVPKVVMPGPVEQKMNVYVVAPEEKPGLGPNDVVVVLANDIARGGVTKQLIKQVSQGA